MNFFRRAFFVLVLLISGFLTSCSFNMGVRNPWRSENPERDTAATDYGCLHL